MDLRNYDNDNIFAKILRGEIPNDTVYEDDYVLAFNDIAPHAPVHILVIPKAPFISMTDFSENAPEEMIVAMHRAFAKIIDEKGLKTKGYRLISNCGEYGGQEVPHLHWHILSGEKIGSLRSVG